MVNATGTPVWYNVEGDISRKQTLAVIFDEWAKRYANNPEAFSTVLDSAGNPIEDYGRACAAYFVQIEKELLG